MKELDQIGRPENGPNVGDAERLASIAAGAGFIGWGLSRKSPFGIFLAVVGGLFVYRGVSGQCQLYRQANIDTTGGFNERGVPGNRGYKVEKTIRIDRSPNQVYHYWRNFENLPKFMPHVRQVEEKNNRLSHWTVKAPVGTTVEWDAEIINERVGEMIAWQSIPGAQVENAGSVWFTPTNRGQSTDVKVSLEYLPPGGMMGHIVAKVFRRAPDQEMSVDLKRFKKLVESDMDSEME